MCSLGFWVPTTSFTKTKALFSFLRARVKILVELQTRPVGNLFNYCFPILDLHDGVEDKMGSCRRCCYACNNLLLSLCVSPLAAILRLRRFAYSWSALTLSLVTKLRFKYLSLVMLVLSPLIFACSLSISIGFLLCGIFFRYTGLNYTLSCALGCFGYKKPVDASQCKIFFVVRKETAGNDVRSLRKDLKTHMDVMQGSLGARQEMLERQVDNVMLQMQKGFAQVDEKIEKLTQEVSRKISEPKGETPSDTDYMYSLVQEVFTTWWANLKNSHVWLNVSHEGIRWWNRRLLWQMHVDSALKALAICHQKTALQTVHVHLNVWRNELVDQVDVYSYSPSFTYSIAMW